MKQFMYIIADPDGIHARPAGNLVKLAKGFVSQITAEANGKTADAKKLFSLMSLGAKQDTELSIFVEGADEADAAAQLEQYLKDNL